MNEETAFVSVHDLSVDYAPPSSLLRWLSGRSGEKYSALRHVRFDLPLGMHAAVYGHEGAGKTTLLRALAGVVKPAKGSIRINGNPPSGIKHLAAGYVSSEELEPPRETGQQILSAFAATHGVADAAGRISELSDALDLGAALHRPADAFSTVARLKLNLARAALLDTPLVLLDDVADQLGAAYTAGLVGKLYAGRTVLVATRHAATAEKLQLPLMLLHKGSIAHFGSVEEIAADLSCSRIVDVWVEGLRYDLLRRVRRHSGVTEARLLPSTQFSGQRLRVTLHSGRYLPSLYDLVSQAPLIRVDELPPSLNDILSRLER
jgi:ABC-type multidrug transport system ATPase subunit